MELSATIKLPPPMRIAPPARRAKLSADGAVVSHHSHTLHHLQSAPIIAAGRGDNRAMVQLWSIVKKPLLISNAPPNWPEEQPELEVSSVIIRLPSDSRHNAPPRSCVRPSPRWSSSLVPLRC
eukprot:6476895-Prymnesium_polylepis.2